MQAGIDTIAAGPGGKGVLFEGFAVTAATTQRGTGVDFAYDTRIKAIKADTVQIDDVRMNMRMSNIDMRLLEKLGNEYNLAERAGMKPEQQAALMFKLFKAMGKSAAARGSALDIDEISAGYRGNRFVIKGKLSLAKSTDAELASMAGVAKKVNVRLNVQVPLALVTDVAMVVMAKQAEAKKEPMSEAALAQAAQIVTDVIVGKLLTGNLAKLENGVLVSLIEYKAGKLTFNGKEVALPKPAPAAPQAAAKN
jgi:uncharacterized protein YdgA (DUF945 family)